MLSTQLEAQIRFLALLANIYIVMYLYLDKHISKQTKHDGKPWEMRTAVWHTCSILYWLRVLNERKEMEGGGFHAIFKSPQ